MSASPSHEDFHSYSAQGIQRDLTAKAFRNPHHSHTVHKADSFQMTTDTERSTSREGGCCSRGIFSFSRFLSRSLILNHFYACRNTGKSPPKPQKTVCPKPQSERFWLAVDLQEVPYLSDKKSTEQQKDSGRYHSHETCLPTPIKRLKEKFQNPQAFERGQKGLHQGGKGDVTSR